MNAITTQSDLKRAVGRVKAASSTRTTLLSYMSTLITAHGEQIDVSAMNGDMQITESIEAEVDQEGAEMLPTARLLGCVTELPGGKLRIKSEDGGKCLLKVGSAQVLIRGGDVKTFTHLKQVEGKTLTLPQNVLKRMLNRTIPFAGTYDHRPILDGVNLFVNSTKIVATGASGHRMAFTTHLRDNPETPEEYKCTIPSAAVKVLISLMDDSEDDAVLTISSSFISAAFGKTMVTSKLIEGEFPSLKVVILGTKGRIQVGREELQSTLRLMRSTLDTADNPSVKFEFSVNSLKLSTAASSQANVEIAVKYHGEPFKVELNPNYILDIANVLDADDLSFEYVDGISPVSFKVDSFVGVVMPLRMQ